MDNNLKQGEHYYFDENGLLVFTEKYLLERGYCCGNGCRHCPYGAESTAADRSAELKDKQNKKFTIDKTD